MKLRCPRTVPFPSHYSQQYRRHAQRGFFNSFVKKFRTTAQAAASVNGGDSDSKGNSFLVPSATAATLLMLGVLHARRLYEDQKAVEAREKGVEFEFQPDVKATFLKMLPLRSISRIWGFLTDMEIPTRLRPYVYKAWAQAFHSDIGEAALPLEDYVSLRDFFVRTLKDGCRPIDPDPDCLISPVDGTVLRFGEIRGPRAMIEQVKGFSYTVTSLLGTGTFLPRMAGYNTYDENEGQSEQGDTLGEKHKKSWWRVSLASPKIRDAVPTCPMKGLYYCVIYLKPGDYHRIHSPVDWNVLLRRHFSGRLFPVNERATRTVRNLYLENERVVLEGLWKEGYLAMAAIGATNIGSIKLFIEPKLKTNRPLKMVLQSKPVEECLYEPEGVGITLKKGEEVAAFNMGSTVVLVFQAPTSESVESANSQFKFCIKRGDRIRMGEALGRCNVS